MRPIGRTKPSGFRMAQPTDHGATITRIADISIPRLVRNLIGFYAARKRALTARMRRPLRDYPLKHLRPRTTT
jgi:hypothetical protein